MINPMNRALRFVVALTLTASPVLPQASKPAAAADRPPETSDSLSASPDRPPDEPAPAPPPPTRPRRLLARGLDGAALVLVLAVLLAPDRFRDLSVTAFLRVSAGHFNGPGKRWRVASSTKATAVA